MEHGCELTLGAIARDGAVDFRVWAPKHERLALELNGAPGELYVPLERRGEYFAATVAGAAAGDRYRFLTGEGAFPDPCSRSQPDGVHGWSEAVDPRAFGWSDGGFRSPAANELVIYELHTGTFTPGGTFDSAIARLPYLRDLGVTAIELMPVAAAPGNRGWGYDGAALFAPHAAYGGPDGLRRLVDAAHRHGLAVILDVVYNHFGPDGNYTGVYSDTYLTDRHHTPWGSAINYDGPGNEHVRRFVRENVLHWRHEYHVDGIRFDATHAIVDDSPRHILAELSTVLRACHHRPSPPLLIAESNENEVRYVRPVAEGGYGFDAVWADDFHHVVRNLLHSEREGYLASYDGSAEELARTIEQGFLFEGQVDRMREGPRGTRARDVPWSAFVYAVQNHDQVGNRAFGLRLGATSSLADYLAASALLLLLPQTPLIFQGQEFAASSPFLFFADHGPELAGSITEGRRREFAAFHAFADPAVRELIPDPQAPDTFAASVLPWDELDRGAGRHVHAMYRELLRLRTQHPLLVASRAGRPPLRCRAVEHAVVVEAVTAAGRYWVAANFGAAVTVRGLPADLGATFNSADARWAGSGGTPEHLAGGLRLPAHCTVLLEAGR